MMREYIVRYTDRYGCECKRLTSDKYLADSVNQIVDGKGVITGVERL